MSKNPNSGGDSGPLEAPEILMTSVSQSLLRVMQQKFFSFYHDTQT